MSAEKHLSEDQFPMVDLYHHTAHENAGKIHSERQFKGLNHRAHFSTEKHGYYGSDYGPAAVHVRVPAHVAELEASYRAGEKFYTVPLDKLKPEHIISEPEAS